MLHVQERRSLHTLESITHFQCAKKGLTHTVDLVLEELIASPAVEIDTSIADTKSLKSTIFLPPASLQLSFPPVPGCRRIKTRQGGFNVYPKALNALTCVPIHGNIVWNDVHCFCSSEKLQYSISNRAARS